MKKYYLPLLGLTSLLAFSVVINKNEVKEAKATEQLSLASDHDEFALLDKEYAVSESFVYTADLHFKALR